MSKYHNSEFDIFFQFCRPFVRALTEHETLRLDARDSQRLKEERF